jgi:hypothetical protein
MGSFAHCFSSFGLLMYAGAEFAPKGPRDGFSTITCQEKREETRTIETETGSQRSPRHNGRPKKGPADAHPEITTVFGNADWLAGFADRKQIRQPLQKSGLTP